MIGPVHFGGGRGGEALRGGFVPFLASGRRCQVSGERIPYARFPDTFSRQKFGLSGCNRAARRDCQQNGRFPDIVLCPVWAGPLSQALLERSALSASILTRRFPFR